MVTRLRTPLKSTSARMATPTKSVLNFHTAQDSSLPGYIKDRSTNILDQVNATFDDLKYFMKGKEIGLRDVLKKHKLYYYSVASLLVGICFLVEQFMYDWFWRTDELDEERIMSISQCRLIGIIFLFSSLIFYLQHQTQIQMKEKEKVRYKRDVYKMGDTLQKNLRQKIENDMRSNQSGGKSKHEKNTIRPSVYDQTHFSYAAKQDFEQPQKKKQALRKTDLTFWDPVVDKSLDAGQFSFGNTLKQTKVKEFDYAKPFDTKQNDYNAERSMLKQLGDIPFSNLDQCVLNTKYYFINKQLSDYLEKYVSSLRDIVRIANVNYSMHLYPENFYQNREDLMLDQVKKIYKMQASDFHSNGGRSLDQFISFVDGLSEREHQARLLKPMTSTEKDKATEAKTAVGIYQQIMHVIKSTLRISPNYVGQEAYILWRIDQMRSEEVPFSAFRIDQGNLTKFAKGDLSKLPLDAEIVAGIHCGVLDQANMELGRHHFDHNKYDSISREDSRIPKKLIGLINTQRVSHSEYRNVVQIPHYEYVAQNKPHPAFAGELNIFSCILMSYAHIVKSHSLDATKFTYGKFDCTETIKYIFNNKYLIQNIIKAK